MITSCPSASTPASSRTDRQPSPSSSNTPLTVRASASLRIRSVLARAPESSESESTMIDFPAPVSPERIFSPPPSSTEASAMTARLRTWISRSTQRSVPELSPGGRGGVYQRGRPYNAPMATDSSAVRERIESLLASCRSVLQREGLQGAVFLYGSSLERDFRPDSDVDLAVLDDSRHPLSWSEQARLMDVLERALGKGVDLRVLRETSPSHQAHVLEQGQLVWSKDPDLVEQY